MIYTEKTKKALALCFEAHKNQVDKAGMPYVFHPFHLAEQAKTEEEAITALLHDVVEDTDTTLDDLAEMGFGVSVIEALRLLTHQDGVDYFDYVKEISKNEIARAVKIADLTHNSTLERLDYRNVTPWDIERQQKYFKALEILGENPYARTPSLGSRLEDPYTTRTPSLGSRLEDPYTTRTPSLASRLEDPYAIKYLRCACCGATTFNEDYVGAFDTCPICGFNDENLVTTDITLEEARAQFLKRWDD